MLEKAQTKATRVIRGLVNVNSGETLKGETVSSLEIEDKTTAFKYVKGSCNGDCNQVVSISAGNSTTSNKLNLQQGRFMLAIRNIF